MTLFQASVLGIIQGITEFLPVSSSGHLILLPYIFGWERHSLTFDVALHLGTLLALLLVFYRKWIVILKNRKYLTLIILGNLPAAIVGLVMEDPIERNLRSPLIVAATLIIVAILMFLAEKVSKKERGEGSLATRDVLIIGLAQSLALIPGVSRSGITITAGLFRNLKSDIAAEFSFLLGTPIIFGAGILKMKKLLGQPIGTGEIQTFGIGMVTATVVGFFAIKYFLKFLKKNTLIPFVWYRIALGLTLIITSII